VGWYRESEDSGRIVQVPDNASIAGDHVPTYAVVAAPGTSTGALAEAVRALGAEMGGEVEVNRSDGTMLAPFRVAMASMTVLVAAVAVAHLLATALATARERTRSTAILRAVGCDTRQLTLASAVSGAVAALCAAVVGVPIGLWLQHVLGDEITKSIGVGPGASPNPPALPTAIVIASLMVLAAGTVTLATVRTSRRAVARVLATD